VPYVDPDDISNAVLFLYDSVEEFLDAVEAAIAAPTKRWARTRCRYCTTGYAALRAGDAAVVALEHGRAMLLADALRA
jgi:hypothetical protein